MRTAFSALEPLDQERRARALDWLAQSLDVPMGSPGRSIFQRATTTKQAGESGATNIEIATMTPKQFMAAKRPRTDVERITCLAYYLTHARDEPHFKTQDLTTLNTEAAGARFSNAAQASNNALNQNEFLAQAGKGRRQITPRGEAMVEALPDREAVTAALADFPRKARRAPRRRANASASS